MASNSANASARGSLVDRILLSPRAQRRLTWISALVFLAGVLAFMVAYMFHNTSAHVNSSNPPAPPARVGKHVKPSKDAYKTAREFLETAVLRKDLHFAYTLVGPPLKAGISRKEWETGNNQVIPYPANNAKTARFHAITSTANKLYIETQLSATKKSGLDAYTFYILLRKQHDGRWLVYYFESENPYGGLPQNGGGAG